MKTTRQLNVFYGDRKVGTLALHRPALLSCLAREIWYCGGIIPCTLTLRGKDKISLSSHNRRDAAGRREGEPFGKCFSNLP